MLRIWFEQLGMWSSVHETTAHDSAYLSGKRDAALSVWNTLSRTQQARLIMEENDGNPAKLG